MSKAKRIRAENAAVERASADLAGTAWTEAEDKLLAELYPTLNSWDVAARLGRSRHAVRIRANLLGLKKTAEITPWRHDEITRWGK